MLEQVMRVGDILRYGRPYRSDDPMRDGFPNYFHTTHTEGEKLALLESGINPIASIADGDLRPAILIASSPHKIGSQDTPWHDVYNTDLGHIRYYGDNKSPGERPEDSKGNKALLEQYDYYQSVDPAVRAKACPLLFFRRVRVKGKTKGYVQFQGFGIIRSVQLVTQFEPNSGKTFANYEYDFAVFSIQDEGESFDWRWISDRRTKGTQLERDLHCPKSWRRWVKDGNRALPALTRRVSKLLVTPKSEQLPSANSAEQRALEKIYGFYDTPSRKKRFEALASRITASIISRDAGKYREGWVTQGSSDGGADFVGRLDVGQGIATVKLIVLGQAKCEKLNTPTGGNHIARTVARLKRGWLGVYVTTSFFSENVQREVYEDEYPIMLVNGLTVAREALRIVSFHGFSSLDEFLEDVDASYEAMVRQRSPEEILLD